VYVYFNEVAVTVMRREDAEIERLRRGRKGERVDSEAERAV
jgi:hypothetical protein